MTIKKQIKKPCISPYTPLLDKGFDSQSSELAAFIFSHMQAHNEDCYIMRFNEKHG